MTDVFKIQTSLELGGNLAPEMRKLLQIMERIEVRAKAIPREAAAWAHPIDAANRAAERLHSTMIKIHRESRQAPTSKNDLVRRVSASAKELAEVRKATQGVGSAARGVGRSFEVWEGRIDKATAALRKMERVANSMRMPTMPAAPPGGYGGRGGAQSGQGRSSRNGKSGEHGGYGHAGSHEGSALAGMVGIGGGVHTMETVVETGIDLQHIALGMKQAGATDAQVAEAKRVAEAGSKAFPNLSTLEVFEHISDLRGILGDIDKATHEAPDILPVFAALKAKKGNSGAKAAMGEVYSSVKSAETANEVTAEGVEKHTNALARLAFWYGDKLNASHYFSAQKAGGQMLNLTSDRFRFGAFSALTQEIGQRAGTQFATFAAKGVAGLRMLGRGLTKAEKYGLLDEKTVKWSNQGLVIPGAQFSDVGLDGKKYDRAADPDLWLYNNVIPKLKKGGVNVDDKTELLRVLGEIFTDKNAYGFLFELAQQRSKIEKDYKGFQGTSGDFREYLKKDGVAAFQGTQAQANSAMTALSAPAIPGIVENLARFNTGLATATAYLEKHPLVAETLMGSGLGVVGGLATAGTVALTIAAVSTLSLPALAIGSVAALSIFGASVPFDKIREALGFKPREQDQREAVDPMLAGALALEKKKTAEEIERDRKREAAVQGLGNTSRNTDDAVKRLGESTGKTGSMAESARPLVDQLGNSILGLIRKLIVSEAAIQQMSFGGGGGREGGSLIHRASLGSDDGVSGSFGGKALGVGSGSGIGHAASKAERAAYIRAAAIRNGIDPEVALRVAQSEGFGRYVGDKGTSFGDWQLHFGGSGIRGMNAGGLGDVLRGRGINAKDPSTWKQQTDFALEWAARHGWGDWHGARRVGIGNRQGIGVKTRPEVTPPPKSRELTAHLKVNLDGRQIAINTTRHQFREGNGPATGANFADASQVYPQIG